jgi:hypothetical protein
MIVVKSFNDQEYLIENESHLSLQGIEQELLQQIGFAERSDIHLNFFFNGELVSFENEEMLFEKCSESCLYLTVSIKQGLVGGKGGRIFLHFSSDKLFE